MQEEETKPSAPTWEQLGLSDAALEMIRVAGYNSPSPVQVLAIPKALEGKDVIVSSQTGSGKTAAFALPMIERFIGREGTFGLILAPTREIVQQIQATFDLLGKPRGIRSICLIGGIDMRIDATNLNTYPHVIVATPGRLCDHLDRGNVWLDFIQTVVLDEADRMLDMGFSDQLARIMEDVPKVRQTLLFSATIPPSVDRLAQKILHDPFPITIGAKSSAATSVEQRLIWTTEEGKKRELMRLFEREKGSIIVFTRSKDGATRLWRSLHSAGIYDATYIHSDRLQSHREQALADFKSGAYRILIATDVAARGIHVDAVAHVINYDLTMEPEDYVHRIGRTGRMDAVGKATTLATPRDRTIMSRIEKLIGRPIEVLESRGSGRSRRPDAETEGTPEGARPRSSRAPAPAPADGSPPRKITITPRKTPLPADVAGEDVPLESAADDVTDADTNEGIEDNADADSSAGASTEEGAETLAGDAGSNSRRRRRRRGRRGRGGRDAGGAEGEAQGSSEADPLEAGYASNGESAPDGALNEATPEGAAPRQAAPAREPRPPREPRGAKPAPVINPRKITLPPRPAAQPVAALEPEKRLREVIKIVSSAIIVPPRDPNAPAPEPESAADLPMETRAPEPKGGDWSRGTKPFPVD